MNGIDFITKAQQVVAAHADVKPEVVSTIRIDSVGFYNYQGTFSVPYSDKRYEVALDNDRVEMHIETYIKTSSHIVEVRL